MPARNGHPAEDPLKKAAILDVAIRAFAADGFRGADVGVIADQAGVGKGTVYRYFGSKEELFWATAFEVLLRLERHLFAAMQDIASPYEKLRASSRAYAEFFVAHPQYLEVFIQDRAEFRGVGPESHRQYHEKLAERFAEIIRQGVEAGEFRPVDPRMTTSALASVLYGCVVLCCYVARDRSPEEITMHTVDIFLQGLRAGGC
jgi:AcrR family transcriptional regulator